MDNELLNLEINTKNGNTIKELVLDRLLIDKVITEEQFTLYNENYQVICIKKSWFKRLFKNANDSWQYIMVKFKY